MKNGSPEGLCNFPEVTAVEGLSWDLGLCLVDSKYRTTIACTKLDALPSLGVEETKAQSQRNKAKPTPLPPGGNCCFDTEGHQVLIHFVPVI